jgi:hypothetical protein
VWRVSLLFGPSLSGQTLFDEATVRFSPRRKIVLASTPSINSIAQWWDNVRHDTFSSETIVLSPPLF